jgi:hypothetical protein
MTDSFAPVEPGPPTQSQGPDTPTSGPSAPFAHTVSTNPPPVVAPAKKQDRTFTILLAVGLLIAVGGVTFAVGRVTAPAATSTRGDIANGGFAIGGTGAGGTGTGGAGFGGVLLTGTVSSVSGNTMTLTEASGTTVTVTLPSTTTYHAQAAATVADVTAGKQVQVQITGGFGGPSQPSASPAASPAVGGTGTATRTITASDVTLVTP